MSLRRALVLCTGNSCRSVMAEALINQLGAGRLQAVSAGSRPTGQVHPQAIATLVRHGIDPGAPRSQSWDDFAGQAFDVVITVCDAAAAETCPLFVGPSGTGDSVVRLHWSTPDPATAKGGAADIDAAFDAAFAQLEGRIRDELLTETC